MSSIERSDADSLRHESEWETAPADIQVSDDVRNILSVELPSDLIDRAYSAARTNGMSMTVLVCEALNAWLSEREDGG